MIFLGGRFFFLHIYYHGKINLKNQLFLQKIKIELDIISLHLLWESGAHLDRERDLPRVGNFSAYRHPNLKIDLHFLEKKLSFWTHSWTRGYDDGDDTRLAKH